MDGHRTAERSSLAYHREIAARLRADARLIAVARSRIDGWRASSMHPRWIADWTELLTLPVDELAHRLVDDSEHMTALRQTTPFAGILHARERWAIWRAVR